MDDDAGRLIAFLQSHALFGGISDEALARVLPKLRPETYAAGELVVKEGDRPDRMHFILSGSAEVFIDATPDIPDDGEFEALRVLRAGDTFGEMGLIDTQPRAASVRALEPMACLSLSGPDLNRIYKEHPHVFTMIVLNLARELSRRLRVTNRRLAEVRHERVAPVPARREV